MDGSSKRRTSDSNDTHDKKKTKIETEDHGEDDDMSYLEKKDWGRPFAPELDPSKDAVGKLSAIDFNLTGPLVFQQMDCDYTLGEPIEGMPGASSGTVPIIRMWGVTEKGNSIQCNVHGFVSYFFVQAPPNFKENDCSLFRTALNVSSAFLFFKLTIVVESIGISSKRK
jgi:DNA polymerase delta subunit 1